ncbi:hypothetical protein [Paramicrobacterium chengjingii]|uniref:hypothetical protein n=1 Tax=Paramicrobacterium chengjingii TaxID=2769067 RepID=UPI0014216FE2|nr:hypothetical protein [Microbacterium chengjingii]
MSGIHIHPHDILDEGMSNIIPHLEKLRDLQYLFPQINTIFERNPVPIGSLPRNPVHSVVYGNGTMQIVAPSYSDRGLDLRREPGISADRDPLMIIKKAMVDTNIEVVPWANILNGHFEGDRLQHNQVIDYVGRPVQHWLCPNGPDVIELWAQVFADLFKRYGFTCVMIDRIRFPDWAGTAIDPTQVLTCFCEHCQKGMHTIGLDPDAVRQAIGSWVALLGEKQFDTAGYFARNNEVLAAWFRFRQDSVSAFIARLIEHTSSIAPGFTLWIDLWPPAYSWFLGQDYAELTAMAPTVKHFPYHKLGGGADVQGLIESLASADAEREAAFSAFLNFFDLPYPLSYAEFTADGFPIEFVRDQNDLVRRKSAPGTRIFSGVQMWNLPPENLVDAICAAEESAADDVLYYCYGWATDDLFEAVRNLRDKGTH